MHLTPSIEKDRSFSKGTTLGETSCVWSKCKSFAAIYYFSAHKTCQDMYLRVLALDKNSGSGTQVPKKKKKKKKNSDMTLQHTAIYHNYNSLSLGSRFLFLFSLSSDYRYIFLRSLCTIWLVSTQRTYLAPWLSSALRSGLLQLGKVWTFKRLNADSLCCAICAALQENKTSLFWFMR